MLAASPEVVADLSGTRAAAGKPDQEDRQPGSAAGVISWQVQYRAELKTKSPDGDNSTPLCKLARSQPALMT